MTHPVMWFEVLGTDGLDTGMDRAVKWLPRIVDVWDNRLNRGGLGLNHH